MELTLDKYSYRSGEDLLNRKLAIKREVEGIILGPGINILSFSAEEYVEIIRDGFSAKGWEKAPSLVDGSGEIVEVMDYRKDRVGVTFGLRSNASPTDMIGFQTARKSESTEIDLGLYIVTTSACQLKLAKASGKAWAGANLEGTVKNFSNLSRQILVPTCVIGLDLYETPLKTIDIDKTAPSIIKELILAYLESKYNTKILKNVCVKGSNAIMEFDGIAKIDGVDTILALELGGGKGNFPSRLRADSIYAFADTVLGYREMSEREISLKFILLGNFRRSFIDEMFGEGSATSALAEGIKVTYEVHSFEELDSYLLNRRAAIAAGK
ncbi:MAG: hypothetical protein HOC20_11980 [Chloroflexi bacterium]|jgi:hypothetical protein|nr:hypothetical protein [Chloroflexota bacterium]